MLGLFRRLRSSAKKAAVVAHLLIFYGFPPLFNKYQRMSLQRSNATLLDKRAFWVINTGQLAQIERMMLLAGKARLMFSATDAAPISSPFATTWTIWPLLLMTRLTSVGFKKATGRCSNA
jgi:hypothetical protein